MHTVLRTSVVLAVLGAFGAAAAAAEPMAVSPGEAAESANAVEKDREVYDGLMRAIRDDRAALSRAYGRGVAEARARGGQPPTATRAEILALRERIDRNGVRLMLVAGRHGWAVPDLSSATVVDAKAEPEPDPRAQLVPPDPVIAEVLSADARKVAAGIRLPVISLAKPRKRS